MMTRALRATAITLLCGLALLIGGGVASAHTRLVGSDPADGASLDTSPERVSLTFNETMNPEFSTLTVIGPDGGAWQTGAVSADGATVGVDVLPLGPAGRYEIGYRVISEDGHPVTGSIAFTLTTPGPAEAAPTPAASTPDAPATSAVPPATASPTPPSDGGGSPVWPWIVGAVVLVGGGVVVALRMAR